MNSSYLQHSFCFRVPRRRTVTPLPSNHCRMRKSSLRWGLGKWCKWWLGLKIYWMILNRVEIHLDGEEKEAELKTIIFSLILLSFFSFQFLNPLPFTLVWASILTQKKNVFLFVDSGSILWPGQRNRSLLLGEKHQWAVFSSLLGQSPCIVLRITGL